MDEHQDVQGEHKAGQTFEPENMPDAENLDDGKISEIEASVGKGAPGPKPPDKKLIQPWLKNFLIAMVLIGLGLIAWFYFSDSDDNNTNTADQATEPTIGSYEECLAAGYPVMESFPEQCAVPGGETFTRQLTAEEQRIIDGGANTEAQNKDIVDNVIEACQQRQSDGTAPSPEEFVCSDIVLVDQIGDYALFEQNQKWMLASLAQEVWGISIWSSQDDNPDICDTGSSSPSLVEYCSVRM